MTPRVASLFLFSVLPFTPKLALHFRFKSHRRAGDGRVLLLVSRRYFLGRCAGWQVVLTCGVSFMVVI